MSRRSSDCLRGKAEAMVNLRNVRYPEDNICSPENTRNLTGLSGGVARKRMAAKQVAAPRENV